MIRHERRRHPRPAADPLCGERTALISAVQAADEQGHADVATALERYVSRGRSCGLDMAQLVTEFRSVYDRSVRAAAEIRTALRRERLVTQLMGIYLRTG
jgi:hypothetical protein